MPSWARCLQDRIVGALVPKSIFLREGLGGYWHRVNAGGEQLNQGMQAGGGEGAVSFAGFSSSNGQRVSFRAVTILQQQYPRLPERLSTDATALGQRVRPAGERMKIFLPKFEHLQSARLVEKRHNGRIAFRFVVHVDHQLRRLLDDS